VSGERTYDLEPVRADGWFERVMANVPALAKLCEGLGEALVALSLSAGFRVVSASIDRVNGEVSSVQWVREGDDNTEVTDQGPPEALRSAVLAALLGDADGVVVVPAEPDQNALRAAVGLRYILLAPLFGIVLRKLTVDGQGDAHLLVSHERGEEMVALRHLRRYLRSRVIDALQPQKSKSVAIDLEEAERARAALRGGRYDEVVGRLGSWVSPLMMYLRTPEGAALEPNTRAELARALGCLGDALRNLNRAEEAEEVLRLGSQYAQDGAAAAELYRSLARVLIARNRRAESIALIRRALSLEPAHTDLLPDLALGFLAANRGTAALGVLRELHGAEFDPARLEAVRAALVARFGDDLARFEGAVSGPR
jgi:tetratricopeptide (TPR) repeat protein